MIMCKSLKGGVNNMEKQPSKEVEKAIDDYAVGFDPLQYLNEVIKTDFSADWLTNEHRDKRLFPMHCYHELFALAEFKDKKGLSFLDFGCGPNLRSLISVAPHASSIVLADYPPANREYLQKWVDNDQETVSAFDWEPYFEYVVCNLERSKEDGVRERIELVRKLIKAVVQCNITNTDSIIQSGYEGPYDVVHCRQTLCVTAQSPDDYKAQLKKLCKLVKPGGTVMLMDAERQMCDVQYKYTVGGHEWKYIGVTREFIGVALEEAGCTDIYVKAVGPIGTAAKPTGYVFFTATKI